MDQQRPAGLDECVERARDQRAIARVARQEAVKIGVEAMHFADIVQPPREKGVMRGVATVAGFELQYAGAIARRPGHRRMLGLVGKAQIDHELEIESMKPLERRRAERPYLPARSEEHTSEIQSLM